MNGDIPGIIPEDANKPKAALPFWPLMSKPEVCEWLDIGETTLGKLRDSEELLPFSIEGRIVYDPIDVQAYIARRKAAAKCELEARRNSRKPRSNGQKV